jgi:thiol-disulfide isomerase/thioredoxin
MKTEDKEKICAWAQKQTHTQKIFLSRTGHPEQAGFDAFTRELARLAPCLKIQPSEQKTHLPAICIADNIHFSALPLEKELAPFLEALTCLAGPLPPLADHIQGKLHLLDHPCRLMLFIALQCPHCPDMVRTLIPLAAHAKKVFLHIIDGSLFPEEARKYEVLSAPCLILNQDFRWTGQTSLKEILDMAIRPDPSQLGPDTLKNILEQGDASWISQQMIQTGHIFEGFAALLLDSTWSVRLGAMVVVETLAEEAPDLAAKLGPILIQAFADQEVPVQGDILYILGEVGTRDTKAWIQKILPGLVHPDLKDAARDALAAIEDES